MDFDKLIEKTELYCDKPLALEKTLNVAYCFDDNFAQFCGVSLFSLLEHNKNINVIIHLFSTTLSESNRSRFKETIDQFQNVHLFIYYVNSEFQISEHNQSNYPLSASLRVIAPEILKNRCEYFLYLDSDTLVVSELSDLFDYQNNKAISAVIDASIFINQIQRKSFHNGLYFNSGVLFINNKKWCEQDITHKAINLLLTNNFTYPDQDALNILLNTDCNYLPTIYNEHTSIVDKYVNNSDGIAKIIHYAGGNKKYYMSYKTPLYRYYFDQTLWKGLEKIEFQSTLGTKDYAMRFKNKNILKFIAYYLIYKYYKLKKN